MSWQTYVDDNLVGTGNIAQAAIIGLDGGTWATSPGFELGQAESNGLVGLYSNPSAAFASGVYIEKARYLTIKADERSIYGKRGAGGVVLVKTGQCVLIGVYTEGMQPGAAAQTVEKLADYLLENGY